MEWLKEFLGDELYSQVEAKLKGNDKVKLENMFQNRSLMTKKKNLLLQMIQLNN